MLQKILFFLLLLPAFLVNGQGKYEKEHRISESDLPASVIAFTNTNLPLKKVKWYRETNEHGHSYEKKFWFKDHKFSVEFSEAGQLEDIEIDIPESEMTDVVAKNYRQQLAERFRRYKVLKIQEQYSGNIPDLTTFLLAYENQRLSDYTKKYEIDIKGKTTTGDAGQYEFTFNENGNFEKLQKITFRNVDNLVF